MRILVISNYFPTDTVGGYERACADTVAYLQSEGHQVKVLSRLWQPTATNQFDPGFVERSLHIIDYQAPSYRQKWQVERNNYQITQTCIARFKPDLIYLWSQRCLGLTPMYATEDSGIPYVFEMGDIWPDSYYKPGIKAACRRWLKGCLPGFKQRPLRLPEVISVSEWMGQELLERYPVEHLSVIPNGTALPAEASAAEALYSPARALFAGRLDPEKGLHLAIEAVIALHQAGEKVQLDIAGQGEAAYIAACQRRIAEAGITESVHFLGWQAMDEVYPRYQVLLMPTTMREPFGLVLIEAMMHGLNVIAPDAYGPAEIIADGETGWLFAPINDSKTDAAVAEIAWIWQALIVDPQRCQQVAQAARNHARSHYALPHVKQQVLHLLQTLAGCPAPTQNEGVKHVSHPL